MKISNELKTGAAVLLALGMLTLVFYWTGDLNVGKKGYQVLTRFGCAGGVKRFAPVRLEGVEVGEVRDIKMIYDPAENAVELTLWVENDVKLRKDSLCSVATLGLMGEKYVEIDSGTAAEFVAPGDTISSKDPISMDEIMTILRDVGNNVNDTLKDFRVLLNNTNGVVVDNREKLNRIIDNVEEASEYARDFAEDIKYNPWKVLSKGKEKTSEEIAQMRAQRAALKKGQSEAVAGEEKPPAAAAAPSATDESKKSGRRMNKGER